MYDETGALLLSASICSFFPVFRVAIFIFCIKRVLVFCIKSFPMVPNDRRPSGLVIASSLGPYPGCPLGPYPGKTIPPPDRDDGMSSRCSSMYPSKGALMFTW